jgi:Skp family chaperone for outer membrane proteins
MRSLILAFVLGLALAAWAQAASLAPKPAAIELGAAPPVELG